MGFSQSSCVGQSFASANPFAFANSFASANPGGRGVRSYLYGGMGGSVDAGRGLSTQR
jgi:hypothetical protein